MATTQIKDLFAPIWLLLKKPLDLFLSDAPRINILPWLDPIYGKERFALIIKSCGNWSLKKAIER